MFGKRTAVSFLVLVMIIMLTGCGASLSMYGGARVMHKQGRYREALRAYNQVIKQSPTDGSARIFRGLLYFDTERYEEAYTDFLKTSKLAPHLRIQISDGYYSIPRLGGLNVPNKGKVFFGTVQSKTLAALAAVKEASMFGESSEAEKWFFKALEADNTIFTQLVEAGEPFATLGWKLIKVLAKSGNSRLLDEIFEQWFERDSRYVLYRKSLGNLLFEPGRVSVRNKAEKSGLEAEGKGNMVSAFKAYSKAYALTIPGLNQEEKEREEILIDFLLRTFKKCNPKPELPEEARRYQVKAQAHMIAGRDERAITAYQKLYQMCPWAPEASFNQALVFGKLGEKSLVEKTSSGKEYFSKAVFWMKRYLELAPDAGNARTAQDKIYAWEAAMEQ